MATQLSSTTHALTRSRDEMVSAARKKLKTFRAKQAQSSLSSCGSASRRRSHSRGSSTSSAAESLPSSIPVASEVARHHQKRRSHSRGASILKLDSDSNLPRAMQPSFTHSPAKPANLGDLNRSFSFGGPKSCPSSAAPVMVSSPAPSSPVYSQQTTPRPRPSSHHRRRSSVSTRRESVDMMGFDPAVSNALKSIGENDKDDVAKVRERALLSLEGKAPKPKTRTIPEIVPTGFSKVEIPEWKTPDVERTFDWGMTNNKSKPIPFSLSLNNSLAGKRDSFGKNLVPSASTKAELAVLVEEEEEEEAADDNKENVAVAQTQVIQSAPEPVAAPVVSSPTKAQPVHASSPSPSRHRPATLNLKVLALASSATVTTLPTPSPTPSPTPGTRPGMKPLNLGNASNTARRRSMMALGSTSSRSSLPASRRQSLGSQSRDSASTHSSRDSLGLNTVVSRLPPTPSTMSPTSMYSSAAGIEGFLQKNQEVLITRIDQLEKALAKSRRISLQSDVSSSSSIAEEQIGLIADLKNERNSLVEEIAGWRTRVEDLERQAALYVQRVESERRESLVVRERVQELERERITWKSDRAAYDEAIVRAREDAASWRAKFEEASRGECYWQAQALSLESDVKRLEKELVAARQSTRSYGSVTSLSRRWNMAPAPRRFDGSVSSASTTDVEDAWSVRSGDMDMLKARPRAPSPLPNMDVVVEEEDEEVYEDSYEEPGLDHEESEPHWIEEDEEDVASDILDEVNQELSASNSVGSLVSSVTHQTESQQPSNLDEPSPNFHFPGAFPIPTPAQGHARTGSMIKGWQMPRGPVAVKNDSPTKPDRFFDQLEHLYATSEEDLAPPANFGFEPVKFGSSEFTTFKGDGGASAFTFGSKRHSMSANFRGHGTRASRASISTAAFDGIGMPPFMNPKPEWIVKNDPAETPVVKVKDDAPPRSVTQGKSGSDTLAHLQGQESSDGDSRGEPRPYPTECKPENSKKCGEPSAAPPKPHQLGDADRTPTMTKPPRFIAAPTLRAPATHVSSNTCIPSSPTTPHTRITTTSTQPSSRTLVRRKPSLTRAQPTRRAPPCVPADTSHDVSRSPFSFSYSRTSSRSSGSRNSIVRAEAAAIEAAIAQAQAAAATAAQSKRLTFIGLTSLLPWGVISGVGPVATTKNTTTPLCVVSEEEERRQSLVQRSERGTVTREAQLERLRRELQVAGQPVVGMSSSGPCCSRCKTNIIQL